LLRGLEPGGPDQVWCADITYVPMQQGFLYLVAVIERGAADMLFLWRFENVDLVPARA
jgi:putative transposase